MVKPWTTHDTSMLVGLLAFAIAPRVLATGFDALHSGAGWIAWGLWWSVVAYGGCSSTPATIGGEDAPR